MRYMLMIILPILCCLFSITNNTAVETATVSFDVNCQIESEVVQHSDMVAVPTFENNTTILHQPSKLNQARSYCLQNNAKILSGSSNISHAWLHNQALHSFLRSVDKYVYAIHRIII